MTKTSANNDVYTSKSAEKQIAFTEYLIFMSRICDYIVSFHSKKSADVR